MQEPSADSSLRDVLTELLELSSEAATTARGFDPARVAPAFQQSSVNLVQYLALRRRDLRPLQHRLAQLGLSSLGRLEANVAPSLAAVLAVVETLLGERRELPSRATAPDLDDASRLIEVHATPLFGPPPAPRNVRIMVTLPPVAADEPSFVRELVNAGMDVARINCAHDGPSAWQRMAENVRRAGRDAGRSVKVSMDLGGPKIRTVVRSKEIRLHVGDRLFVSRAATPEAHHGKRAPARIGCTRPEALRAIREGQAIFFDDGACGGVVRAVSPSEIEVEVTRARAKGAKLTSDKGINLPDLRLELPALTAEDREDLRTVVDLADIVCLSLTQHPKDVHSLREALRALGHPELGVVAKIETRTGFESLPAILMALMEGPSAGLMIARGDLAVELGYERLAEVQEEILWVCEAAHMPVIWATQVLESLVKKGLPSRGDITDAAMGERAECVMLNKGPYVLEGIAALDSILRRMAGHHRKKSARMRPLASFRPELT